MSSLVLTQEIKDLVNNALESGNPILLAAVDVSGRPVLSFRGSTTVRSDDQLGVWARNATGGTIEAIKHNPNVALMYRSATVPLLRFEGRGRVVTDAAERNAIFEAAPQRERDGDPQRRGTAIVVDLDTVFGVLGFNDNGPIIAQLKR
jgi:hypothetical protein